ncbi:hypothetical protein Hanom_Chr11g00990841 [Helianthus anomalus]
MKDKTCMFTSPHGMFSYPHNHLLPHKDILKFVDKLRKIKESIKTLYPTI